jgi:tetratricopeptide (TPR) repeat protein
VANIKGRDEILALLLSLWSSWLMLLYIEKKNFLYVILGAVVWFLALLSKENAFVFLVLMPVVLFLPASSQLKPLLKPFIGFIASALIFLWIRHQVIGEITGSTSSELMNNSFLEASINQKYATIFLVLGKYVSLLFFPHPLTYDYYPYHIPLVTWSTLLPLASFLFYCFLIGIAIRSFRRNYLLFVAITFFLLPLLPVSNLLFPIGTFMNERFLYFSSIGFCLIVAYWLVLAMQKQLFRKLSFFVLLILLVLYGFKTIHRNKTWYNDYTLFTTDVKTSVNSAKSNCSAGGILLDNCDSILDPVRKNAVILQSIGYLRKAISIHPTYADAWLLLGNAYYKKGNAFDSSLLCYSTILKTFPQHKLTLGNLFIVAEKIPGTEQKLAAYETYLKYDTTNFMVYYKIGQLYGREKNDLVKSVKFLSQSIRLNPNAKEAYIDLGVAYGLQKNYNKSAEMLEKAIALDPSNPNIYINLGLTYNFLGNALKARECFAKADSIKKKKL